MLFQVFTSYPHGPRIKKPFELKICRQIANIVFLVKMDLRPPLPCGTRELIKEKPKNLLLL